MRFLVISDIHGNLDALETVLDDAGAFDRVINLGDIVDYGAHPNECIDRVKRLKAINLVGNHDLVQIGQLPLSHMHSEAAMCGRWTMGHLTPKSRDWLKIHTPERVKPDYYLVHGTPFGPALDYINSTGKARRIFESFEFPILFHGHSHVAIVFTDDDGYASGADLDGSSVNTSTGRYIINPGSVGQPRDGDERAAYGIWEDGVFTWHRVEYDISSAQRAIREAGLPESQADRLLYGS